VREH